MPTATGPFLNWAGNVRFGATALAKPASLGELQGLVASSRRVRPIGTAHSFSPIADTDGCLVSAAGLPALVEVDTDRAVVRVSAGLRYSDFAPRLHQQGLALPNLASLPHISVGGAVATGTHGSGNGNGSLATAVSGLELVTAGGDLITVRREDPSFDGMVVALGACGVVTALTLQAVPAFTVRQYVYTGVPFDLAAEHFAEITASGYSVSMFTDWRERRFTQVWRKLAGPADAPGVPQKQWFGGTLADHELHPIGGLAADSCSPQLGRPGPWHERLPHFRPQFTPSAGNELQSEYLLPREHAADALTALAAVGQLAAVTQVSEVRTVAADDLWLSMAYQRDSVAFHFTWVPDTQAVLPVVAAVEAVLRPFAARPHWGKIFAMSPESVAGLYPRIGDFRLLAGDMDPGGKFGNKLLDPLLGRAGSG